LFVWQSETGFLLKTPAALTLHSLSSIPFTYARVNVFCFNYILWQVS
jgi:hypothetical protein